MSLNDLLENKKKVLFLASVGIFILVVVVINFLISRQEKELEKSAVAPEKKVIEQKEVVKQEPAQKVIEEESDPTVYSGPLAQ